jgi:single-strand DNA-binding protein
MAGLNKIQIIGNLGRDPEMRYTPQGTAVTSFSVAVNRKWTDRDGQLQEETLWFRVSAWNRLAETCNQYLSKGKQVYIEGRLRAPSVFTDQNGVTRAGLEITANDMVMLGSRGETGSYQGSDDDFDYSEEQENRSAPAARPAPSKAPPARNQPQRIHEDEYESEDEIPF